MSSINEQPFRPTPFEDPREANAHLGKAMSPSKFRSSQKHQRRRNAAQAKVFGKAYADMSPEERLAVREALQPRTGPGVKASIATRGALDFAADLTAGRPGASLGGTHYRLVERRRNSRGFSKLAMLAGLALACMAMACVSMPYVPRTPEGMACVRACMVNAPQRSFANQYVAVSGPDRRWLAECENTCPGAVAQ